MVVAVLSVLAYCSVILTGRSMGLGCLSVHPSIIPFVPYEPLTRQQRCRKTKIVANVSTGRSNQCASFQLKQSKVRVMV